MWCREYTLYCPLQDQILLDLVRKQPTPTAGNNAWQPRYAEEDKKSPTDGGNAFDHEEPLPRLEAMDTIEMLLAAVGNQTTESPCNGRGDVVECLIDPLVSL
jgi:hypothetical protein